MSLCLLLVPLSASNAAPAPGKYWVVGSFESMRAASARALEIEAATGEDADVGVFDLPGGTRYRIVVARDLDAEGQRRRLADAGIEPWVISASDVTPMDPERPVQPRDLPMEYYLVVGTFLEESGALRFADSFDMAESETRVWASTTDGRKLYRVMVGPYESRDANVQRSSGVDGAWWLGLPLPAPESEPIAPIASDEN